LETPLAGSHEVPTRHLRPTQQRLGKIHILSPWRLVDYWRWTREPDLGDFTLA
jgi:hypothetical protein